MLTICCHPLIKIYFTGISRLSSFWTLRSHDCRELRSSSISQQASRSSFCSSRTHHCGELRSSNISQQVSHSSFCSSRTRHCGELRSSHISQQVSHSSFCSSRTHHCGELRSSHIGQQVSLCGWVQHVRMGGQFVLIRDAQGITQVILQNQQVRLDFLHN